jgi:hypothetical protein
LSEDYRTEDYYRFFNLNKINHKTVRTVEKGFLGADVYKKYVYSCITEEMKYRARKTIRKYFDFVTNGMKSTSSVFMYYETNIDKNTSDLFILILEYIY